jgi:hypothetical protein
MHTTGDGLCGYRALYQLYNTLLYKEIYTNTNITNDECNKHCNGLNPNLLTHKDNHSFTTFLTDLLNKVNEQALTNDQRFLFNNEIILLQNALRYILPFITQVRSRLNTFMPSTTNAWMNDAWLIHCMKLLEMNGNYIMIIDFITRSHPSTQQLGMISNTTFSHRTAFNYDECLQIFSYHFITFSNSHFEVEPFIDINYDIQLFQLAINDVMNKLFLFYF